jgi:hypothetical protein
MLKLVKGDGPLGTRLVTFQPIRSGTRFFRLRGHRAIGHPTYQTVQIGPRRHALSLGKLQFINHSCAPNVVIDTARLACYAAHDIATGEELSYFYPSTEWEMARPFLCMCGVPNCIRIVTRARHLSTDVLSRYFINEHVRALIARELASVSRQWKARLRAAADR